MKTLALILILAVLGAPAGWAVMFPVVELTSETLEKEGFAMHVTSKVEGESILMAVGFRKVPAFFEERCEAVLRIREGNHVSLEATLKPASGFKDTKVAYLFKIPKELLPRAELYLSEGTHSSFDHKILVPLAKFVKVE